MLCPCCAACTSLLITMQGDGINIVTIGKILDAAVAAGFSAENVAFGMGGGLLQRVNRWASHWGSVKLHAFYLLQLQLLHSSGL
jgi:hypothetical protein